MSGTHEDIQQIDKMRIITDYINRAGFVAMNEVLRNKVMKLSVRQCSVLAKIRRYTLVHPEGISMSTLAARSNMSPSAASHMIDSLISQGMVERNQSTTDRRTVLITIARSFQTTVAAVEEAQQKANEKLRSILDEEEARVYDAVLNKLYTAVAAQDEY
jgi:DNA-binding MarR family transcriptional regulator